MANLVVQVLWLTEKHAMSQAFGNSLVIKDKCYDIITYTQQKDF